MSQGCGTTCRQHQQRCAAISQTDANFKIPAAPDFIPDGPWEKVAGGNVCTPKGFKATGAYGGLRASGVKADLALVVADNPAAVGGTFTLNRMCAAPVTYCREVLARRTHARAVLTNAGQANAATGDQGYADAVQTAKLAAQALGMEPDDVLIQSTGVIGKRMKMEAFVPAIPEIAATLGASQTDGHRAAVAITTTGERISCARICAWLACVMRDAQSVCFNDTRFLSVLVAHWSIRAAVCY
jgi:glutamate N-acetyltransferase/amino-acid N-acetyltransferase